MCKRKGTLNAFLFCLLHREDPDFGHPFELGFKRLEVGLLLHLAVVVGVEEGSVCIDNEKCGYEITKMMIDKGNQKITFISTIHPYLVNELMVKGYIKAMKEAGLEPDIIKTTGVLEANEQHFTEYLDKNPVPEVALAVRDSMAISFMNVAQKRGIKVPDQLQVMGFQNTRYSQLSYPKLSCVENPIYEIGNVAMSELTDLMKDDTDKKPSNIIVDYKIVLRDSTK